MTVSSTATSGQLKEALRSRLAQDGTLDAVSSSLQAQLYTVFMNKKESESVSGDLKEHKCSQATQSIHDLIIEYLKMSGLNASLSVFARETGHYSPGTAASFGAPLIKDRRTLLRDWPGLSHLPADIPLLCGILSASTETVKASSSFAAQDGSFLPAILPVADPDSEGIEVRNDEKI